MKKYKSLKLKDQEIIKIIDSYATSTNLKNFIKREFNNLSDDLCHYAHNRRKELKKQEMKKYYHYQKSKYLRTLANCHKIETLLKYKDLDLSESTRNYFNNKLAKLRTIENLKKEIKQQESLEYKSSYEQERDKLLADFLSKGGKIKTYDFGEL